MQNVQTSTTETINRVVFKKTVHRQYGSTKIIGIDYEMDHVPVSADVFRTIHAQCEDFEIAASGVAA